MAAVLRSAGYYVSNLTVYVAIRFFVQKREDESCVEAEVFKDPHPVKV
jgi:hypothetical protein